MTRWSEDEEQYLRENASYGNYEEIADELDRSYSSVKSKAQKLDIKTRISWTEDKITHLKNSYPEKTDKKIASELGCTEKAVKNKRQELSIVNDHLWSDKEEEFIKENWRQISDRKMAEELGRSVNSIRNRRKKLGIRRPEAHNGKFNQGIKWTDEKVDFLKEHYSDTKWEKIADKFDTSYQAIRDKAHRLGLEKQDLWSEDEIRFLENNWQQMSDQEIADELNRSLGSVMQKRSKNLNLIRKDPTGNEYKWREWEKKCEQVAERWFETVKCQVLIDEGLKPDIFLPELSTVIEVKWCYYEDWEPEKYLEHEDVDKVVVWTYHRCIDIDLDISIRNRYDLIPEIEDENLAGEIKSINGPSVS
jgi:DNA-directed RNA polymerase specialized sigma24 family protein